jgi:hypothetical protein
MEAVITVLVIVGFVAYGLYYWKSHRREIEDLKKELEEDEDGI